ncbi:hypothetical protein KJ693_11020 [bacterium]|nr:hypothetical protein [bacterium]
MNGFKELASFVASEFDKYLLEHQELGGGIKQNSVVVFQIDGEKEFNRWHKEISLKYREENQPVTYIHIKGFRTISVLREVEVERAVAVA